MKPIIHTIQYPLPIFQFSFPQVVTKQDCIDYRNEHPKSNNSNIAAWHSDYRTNEKTDKFNPLIDLVVNTCTDISTNYFNAPLAGKYKYVLDNLWIAMYEQKDYTIRHAHFPSTFAACYYIEVDDQSSPITFGVNKELSIQPENGMLLVWMGMIPHCVASTKSKRTCICMNVRLC
tara:strand:+ start:265 stop:789 length:525 start_codon:yes stop_codon:yes gene_type:complete